MLLADTRRGWLLGSCEHLRERRLLPARLAAERAAARQEHRAAGETPSHDKPSHAQTLTHGAASDQKPISGRACGVGWWVGRTNAFGACACGQGGDNETKSVPMARHDGTPCILGFLHDGELERRKAGNRGRGARARALPRPHASSRLPWRHPQPLTDRRGPRLGPTSPRSSCVISLSNPPAPCSTSSCAPSEATPDLRGKHV